MPLFMDVHDMDGGVTPADAPVGETATDVHRKAHGLVADEIYPVTEHA